MRNTLCRLLVSRSCYEVHCYGSVCANFSTSHVANESNLKCRASVASTLDSVNSYHEEGRSPNVCHLFDEVPRLDVVSATAVISQAARFQRYEEAISLFSTMLAMGIVPNKFTFGTVLHSSSVLGDLVLGRQLHACTMKLGLQSNVFVGSAVIDVYAKLSTVEEAKQALEDTDEPNIVSYTTLIYGYLKKKCFEDALQLFKEMPERNVVTWNVMIGGYSQKGNNEDAVNLFVQMMREGFVPNKSTFPSAFSAASNIGALGIGKSFHACGVKLFESDLYVDNSLISFYAKCGSMEDSLVIFYGLQTRNIVSWNAVISGYAQNGRAKEALSSFEDMQVSGLRPNSVTLLALLLACSHAGFVAEGYRYLNKAMLEDPDSVKPEHYACMVDLLSRSGRLLEAEKFMSTLPLNPGIGFWKALLGGCQIHSNMDLGRYAAQQILALDPEDVSSYVMLSNAHSAAGRWQSVSTIREKMKERNMKRVPGCSWIEVKNKVNVFVTRDHTHVEGDAIYGLLGFCFEHIRDSETPLLIEY